MSDETQSHVSLADLKYKGPFKPFACYDPDGDCATFMFMQGAYKDSRINKWVTVFISRKTDNIIGCLIKDIRELLTVQPGLVNIEIHRGRVRIAVLLRASGWTQAVDDERRNQAYRKLIKAAEHEKAAIPVPG